ncbi:MAG: redox-regulated ATPase YchF [bacterium]|nr:redox-regulated ATPase YchF [bacterium]
MKIGLIGLPLVGKTTVFNLLTGRSEETTSFGGGKRESHLATIKVPDMRIDALSAHYKPRKTTLAEIEFLDVPGFKVGHGGIPSDQLNEMRNLDALVHVLRFFESDEVLRDDSSVDGLSDALSLEQELILTDLLLVEKRLERLRIEFGKGRKELALELELMERLAEVLEGEKPLRTYEFSERDEDLIKGYQLVSRLPMILLANIDDAPPEADLAKLEAMAGEGNLAYLALNSVSEWEILQLPEEDRQVFLEDLGVEEPARDRFIQSGYSLLDLVSFFTVGEDEVRAWTIAKGLPAVRAAGKIHSDLERGFIRAEVIACDRFFELGGMTEARKEGALRLEGKEYPVQDGDIMNIRFSV